MKPDPKRNNAEPLADTEADLQAELRRESEEHADLGDADTNRNLSGSSTWATLPTSDRAQNERKR